MQFLDIFGHFALFVPAHGWPLNPTSAFIDNNVITGCCCNDIYGKNATPGYYHPIFPPFAWKLNFWSKVEAGGGGWWTVWSQTPPITLKLGRCAQGHNWVRIVSECRDILMLWYFQPPLFDNQSLLSLKHKVRLEKSLNETYLEWPNKTKRFSVHNNRQRIF